MFEYGRAGETGILHVHQGDHGGCDVGVEGGDLLLCHLLQALQRGTRQVERGIAALGGREDHEGRCRGGAWGRFQDHSPLLLHQLGQDEGAGEESVFNV